MEYMQRSSRVASQIATAIEQLDAVNTGRNTAGLFAGLLLLRLLLKEQEKEEVSWRRLQDSPFSERQLIDSIDRVERRQQKRQLDRFLSTLGVRDLANQPSLCREMVDLVSKVDLVHSMPAELWETLIAAIMDSSGRETAQVHTPSEIASLMVEMLQPGSGATIYDPACGSGGLLVAAANFLGEGDKSGIFGRDKNEWALVLAGMGLLLNGLSLEHIELGDSLSGKTPPVSSFDYVISNPPAGLAHSRSELGQLWASKFFTYGSPTRFADFNFIQHALALLGSQGRAALLVSLRPLFIAGEEGAIRRRIVDADLVEAVISLPPRVLSHTSARPAVLLLNKNKPENRRGKILFIHTEEEGWGSGKSFHRLGTQYRERVLSALRDPGSFSSFASLADRTEVQASGYILLPSHFMAAKRAEIFLGADARWLELAELAEVLQGARWKIASGESRHVPLIQGRDLAYSEWAPDSLEIKPISMEFPGSFYSKIGDVLIQRIGEKPKASLITAERSGILVGETVYIIRLREVDLLLASFLVDLLNSRTGQLLLSGVGGGAVVSTLRLTDLRRLRVPIPNRTILNLARELSEAERGLRQRVDQAHRLRNSMFELKSSDLFDVELKKLGVEAQVLRSSIVQADDHGFQIRNFYPHMLAYPYRSLESIRNEVHFLYKEQLRAGEGLLAFLGSIGLALVAWTGVAGIGELVADFRKNWKSGASPGDWRELGQRSAGFLRGCTDVPVATGFASLWYKGRGTKKSDLSANLVRLVELKNDFKHDRGPSRTELREAINELDRLLTDCLRAVSFFVQHPIRLVVDVDGEWQAGSQTVPARLDTLRYVGDHPGLTPEALLFPQPLPKGQLFIEAGDESWVPLYPLISAPDGASGLPESYMIDSYDGPAGFLRRKSFERGTALKALVGERILTDMEHWLARLVSVQQ